MIRMLRCPRQGSGVAGIGVERQRGVLWTCGHRLSVVMIHILSNALEAAWV